MFNHTSVLLTLFILVLENETRDQTSRLAREASSLKEEIMQREGKARDVETSSLVPLQL